MEKLVNLEERVNVNGEVDTIALIMNEVFKKVDKDSKDFWIKKTGNLINTQYGLYEEEYDKVYDIIKKTKLKFNSLEQFVDSQEYRTIINLLDGFFRTRFYEGIIKSDDIEICFQKGYIENLRHVRNKTNIIKKAMKQSYLYIDALERRMKSLTDLTDFTWGYCIENRDKILKFIGQ